MSTPTMEGLAEQLRKLCRTANPEACEIYERWASEVEAARASLPAPLPDEEWLKEARRLESRLYESGATPFDLNALLAHLRARHSADTGRLVSDEKEITGFGAILGTRLRESGSVAWPALDREESDTALLMRDAMDALDKFDNGLSQWAQAYPLSAFPEPDLRKAHEFLQAGSMTLDAVSASNMRHVVTTLDADFAPVRATLAKLRERLGEAT